MKIYDLAVKDKQEAQQIKAGIYLIKYRNLVEEDNNENNIFYVDTLIEKTKAPVKNIFQSMQAEMFWQYIQNNRYKFYNRTQLAEEKSKDIATWSLDKLNSTATKLYKASLSNDALLKTTKLENFDPIIVKGINTRQLRPTLFDFLAHRALSYFTNDEKDISRPSYAFTIKEENAFAPADQFVNIAFKTKDTESLYHKALLLFQDILKFHLKDANPDALIDADLIRLEFVNEKSVIIDKEKMYESALQKIENKYPQLASAAQASYLRANIYYSRGQNYDPLTKADNQYEIKRAKEICDLISKKFPASEGGVNALNLLNKILQTSISNESENVNTIGQPFRSLISYKNTSKIYLRIIKISHDDLIKYDRKDDDQRWSEILKLKALKEWSVALPDLQDFQQHRTEIKTDALNSGVYYMIASNNAGFGLQKNILARQIIYVSNISYVHNGNDYYVLDRDNGQPIAGAKAQVWENKYNSGTAVVTT